MIKNRNIARDAFIDPSKVAGFGAGEIFYVCQTANSAYSWLNARVPSENLFTTITAALAATVTERNDYVYVWPDATDYDEDATLTISKNNVHLICPAGLGARNGCSGRAATIDPNSAAHAITITGRGCEVAGFWIRGYAEKYLITIQGNGNWVHHNHCAIASTSSSGTVAGGIQATSAGVESRIEDNYIFSNAGTTATILFGIQVNASASRTSVTGNRIAVFNGCTMTTGIWIGNGCAMAFVDNNIIQECTAGGGVTEGTVTVGVTGATSVLCSRNLVGIAGTNGADGFVGGTSGQSYVGNYTSYAGGTLGV